jgi:hypothetical protein
MWQNSSRNVSPPLAMGNIFFSTQYLRTGMAGRSRLYSKFPVAHLYEGTWLGTNVLAPFTKRPLLKTELFVRMDDAGFGFSHTYQTP